MSNQLKTRSVAYLAAMPVGESVLLVYTPLEKSYWMKGTSYYRKWSSHASHGLVCAARKLGGQYRGVQTPFGILVERLA